jgi:hypothetical protein
MANGLFAYESYHIDPMTHVVRINSFNGPDDILEQFIGLSDFEGTDIYEGDILDGSMFPDESSPWSVIFEDACYRKSRPDWPDGLPKPALSDHELSILQDVVIGNIHQNPELLK